MTHQDLKKHRRYGPRVRLITLDGCMAVEKTYREAMPPIRLLGAALIAWERFIYSRLAGIEGIPEVLPCPDRLTLTTRFMGGTNLKEADPAPDLSYFDALERLISDMHRRGVIHLDLRNRRNYGIDDRGRPYLVDFATCLYIPWDTKVRKPFEAIDWMGFAKVKHKLQPGRLDTREEGMYSLGMRLSSWWLPTRALRIIRKLVKRR
ncbi:MAG: hypothetical protein GXY28_12520 [Bacteriovoracaceae bacterium]|jgi:hypothetical protein|nr:hypothetical protein [Deltaproteobacteria bacterium]MDI9542251.1 hypothetical protein [Pseudomonadota bacterium]NLW68610.1 hypothetical protein [Bacteriovoracaceae bacterium]HPX48831.1 hypothetical protein [Deltaproteobacteria bacterium]HQA71342.1 hypothetical protein [Deltaproteobacteria bacterium]